MNVKHTIHLIWPNKRKNEVDDQDDLNSFIQELDDKEDFDLNKLAQDFIRNLQ